MLDTPHNSKTLLLRVAEFFRSGDAAESGPGDIESFLTALYRSAGAEELRGRSVENLAGAARSIWQFMAERSPGKPKIRLLTPRDPGNEWLHGRSVLQIVNDDMPFLVDSVTAALNAHDLVVLLVVHPVIQIKRDAGGRLLETGSGAARESVMYIELAGAMAPEAAEKLVEDVGSVLSDVRSAVSDFAGMVGQCVAASVELGNTSNAGSADDVAEASAFISWLTKNNFTFLGCREYALREGRLAVVAGSGKGILTNEETRVFGGLRDYMNTAPEVQALFTSSDPILVSKANQRSTVHRPVLMDTISIKRFALDGTVRGQYLIAGLFTTAAYARPLAEVPLLRRKVARIIERSHLPVNSHDGKALQQLLDTFPRDEMFQTNEAQLYALLMEVLRLQEKRRVALFTRRDPFERYLSCLIYMPRDRYSADIRAAIAHVLADAYQGESDGGEVHLDDSPLARLHFIVQTTPGRIPDIATSDVEASLSQATQTFSDRLFTALIASEGEETALESIARYRTAFPVGYTSRSTAETAIADLRQIRLIEDGKNITISLEPVASSNDRFLLKIFNPETPVALSDILPLLENFGMRVLSEIPHEIRPKLASKTIWLQELELQSRLPGTIEFSKICPLFEEGFLLAWAGELENDGFNRLVPLIGLSAREITVLRAYAKIWRQAGTTISQAYMEDTLAKYPAITDGLVRLFTTRFDPDLAESASEAEAAKYEKAILDALDEVSNLDEDRILRSYLLLISKSLRTNYYQRDQNGKPKSYLSIKLFSREIDLLPLPRPLYEIYVYSVRMEGVHLRGGKVARGGIRWSDRKEDFRTEILGLMKAQQVKNAVIVPVGSKGGFVVKTPPANRDELMAEVIACYRLLICGMLDLTDNYAGQDVVPPKQTVRLDNDDPYLVVAADKGTATFSDIANGIAREYGFWLDDAFASGGSVGYDHKKMGITARGAWEAVKRHFRELGKDIQTTDFDCIGVGDMSGDVFGNGALLSRHMRLIAAFDHRHIFIDPNPDPAVSWAERQRMFDLPRSSWADYDKTLLSVGGGIYERGAKSIRLSPEARARLNIAAEALPPHELIHLLLQEPVDLLWFGGIGTYVKSASESHADVRDRANDALRVDGREIKAKVVGEGANLAVSQRGRIEYALAGGRIDTDAIDNSAGVDTSDHEVNIKIGAAGMIQSGALTQAKRNEFLAAMTGEVAGLVLRDNYLQTQALSLAEAKAADELEEHQRLMRALERGNRLDRALEFLPDDEAIAQRQAAKRGLTRPELAVLLAYAKNALYAELLETDLPDAHAFDDDLIRYFPQAMTTRSRADLEAHRLRREIVATQMVNEAVNRLGPSFIFELQARIGRSMTDVLKAYRIVRDLLDLPSYWGAIEALDNQVPADLQTRLFLATQNAAAQAIGWFLSSSLTLDIEAYIERFRAGIMALQVNLVAAMPEDAKAEHAALSQNYREQGVPAAFAEAIATLQGLASALDIVRIGENTSLSVPEMARLYFKVGDRLGIARLRIEVDSLKPTNRWQRLARIALNEDLDLLQRDLVCRIVSESADTTPEAGLERWLGLRAETLQRIDETRGEIGRAHVPDLAILIVATRQIRGLAAI